MAIVGGSWGAAGAVRDGIVTTADKFKDMVLEASRNLLSESKEKEEDKDEGTTKVGANGTQTNNTTTGQNGKTERIDVENHKPGEIDGNIHYHEPDNTKWYYDIVKKIFVDGLTNGTSAPSRIQKVLKQPWVQKAIAKALKILGE